MTSNVRIPLANLVILSRRAQHLGTEALFIPVALEWAAHAQDEIDRLRVELISMKRNWIEPLPVTPPSPAQGSRLRWPFQAPPRPRDIFMMLLDEHFLCPHPDTVVRWGQRAQCRACAHHTTTVGAVKAERCLLQPNPQGRGGLNGAEYGYCIDARRDNGVCGPHATLFVARSGT